MGSHRRGRFRCSSGRALRLSRCASPVDQFELPPGSVASEQCGSHGNILGSSAGLQTRSGGPVAFQDAALEDPKCHLHHHPARNLSGFRGWGGEHSPCLSTGASQNLELYFQAMRERQGGCGRPELPLATPAAQAPLISGYGFPPCRRVRSLASLFRACVLEQDCEADVSAPDARRRRASLPSFTAEAGGGHLAGLRSQSLRSRAWI